MTNPKTCDFDLELTDYGWIDNDSGIEYVSDREYYETKDQEEEHD